MNPKVHLPPNTLLPKDTHDPLLHKTTDFFWYHIEPFFNPLTSEDIRILQPTKVETPSILPVNPIPFKDASKAALETEHDAVARLQSYPLSQRLTAALLDEGRGQANAAKPIRSGLSKEDTWIGGPLESVQGFNHLMEERLRAELQQIGLLDSAASSDVLPDIQMGHWHLRNLSATNESVQREITKKAIVELQSQGTRRQKKISEDQVEIKYLETMVEKGGKRGKGRFNKLLNQMHPNRHLKPGDPVSNSQKPIAAVVGDKTISKKRKRKNLACDRVAKKNSDANGALPIDASDNLAPHIAAIIWKHDNQALIDDIVKEFLERVPLLAGDVKEARRRITNCMSFSRKPYRFRKLPDGITYSASRV